MASRLRTGALFGSLLIALSAVAVDTADARRGGSFGSRGARTYQSAPPTATAPNAAAPVQRSMTSPSQAQPGAAATGATAAAAQRSRGGMFGGLLGGLALGGLFGMLMGTGFGGLGGFMALIVQALLIGLGVFLLMKLFRRRSASTPSYAGPQGVQREAYPQAPRPAAGGSGVSGTPIGARAATRPAASTVPTDTVGITPADFDTFERRLGEVQAAFTREDYGTLRQITTPEIMSYLSEELGENATEGRKNDVSSVKLLQGDLAEAWREGRTDYATVAMRYEAIDVMRDRSTRAVVSGDPSRPTETTELWTFVRENGGDWKLSAIQES
ncbi:Tim44 domain-containing protein [Aurantimonas sp. Leaf443]|uniref:Tim44 domain-containing protein n=1 Tax=Aurantimonas sp. Leaf443 TaxID=1736378 RepID=UPI0006F2497B|nr:Tim44 domain-containing protein [Aurantimonas sp. Leaf443]KQT86056.1 hypothetical protein ASG48_05590 [Aurantimonas sp. Leaf443]